MNPSIIQARANAATAHVCPACDCESNTGACDNANCDHYDMSAADDAGMGDTGYFLDAMQEKAVISQVRSRGRYLRSARHNYPQ